MKSNVCPYIEVLGLDLIMLGQVEVLLRNEHTLTEEVLVDLLAVRLWNQPSSKSVLRSGIYMVPQVPYILPAFLRVVRYCCERRMSRLAFGGAESMCVTLVGAR